MQNYGTEVRRGDDPQYWVKQWQKKVSSLLEQGKSVCCDDVRFLNEADAVKLSGGKIVAIRRDDITNTGSHASETEQSNIEVDYTVVGKKGEHETVYGQIEEILNGQGN